MSVELLQHNITRFGAVTVMDVILKDVVTGKPILELDSLRMSNISGEGEEKIIMGGIGAPERISYNFSRKVNVEIEDALASIESLKTLWGGEYQSDNITYTEKKSITLTSAQAAGTDPIELVDPLNDTDSDASQVFVYNKTAGTELVKTTNWTYAAGDVTMVAGATAGEIVEIHYLSVATKAGNTNGYTPSELVLKAAKFPALMTLVGKTQLVEEATGKIILAEIEIPKFKMNGNFELTLQMDGDASVFNASGKALATQAEELIKIKTIRYQ